MITLVTAQFAVMLDSSILNVALPSVILARTTGRGRARAMSGWGAASTVGGAAGVTLGGILTAAVSWQSVLFVTGSVAAVVGVAGWMLLPPENATTRRSFDAAGASLLTPAQGAASDQTA